MDLITDSRAGDRQRLGLFDWQGVEIIDIEGCPQLSPALEEWLRDFRRIPIPVRRGSLRLRVAPDGRRGVWLDLANIDVKRLLEERVTLDRLREQAVVEIGQRRKRLVERAGQLKLADPELAPWFQTWTGTASEKPLPLFCTIGSFTQPGFIANRALVDETMSLVRLAGARRVIEFGSGIGNFTLPMAVFAEHIDACEIDELALEGLKKSLTDLALEDRVSVHRGNFHDQHAHSLAFGEVDLVLVDPPRSGLKRFLEPVVATRPKSFVYVSCFADSFALDASRLLESGYQIESVSMVDQFPQSRHFEIVALFSSRS